MNNIQALDISKFLPHRAPFLMVDRIMVLEDDYVSTEFYINKNCIFLDENANFSEVGLIENAAQTCSAIVGKSYFEDDDTQGTGTKLIGFISGIKKVTVNSCPEVDQTIYSQAKLKSRFDADHYSICALECVIKTKEKELLSCEMNLFIQELPNEK
ncbi:beta-hydroxyacyl-ACP dehydratase FabA/FabZ [Lacinutrix sp. 5H-3-7-4]|uniref:beta-hydroxyacyl-ACP dehydratase FabA/FabZ n=1 Tax=Lacinutrix sp. (strain 5H-3-7-4) TaxID=983544 RepID=UPI00020A3D15|nr:beta-hydroxyacyl-ACP dehydratase FabA/FabZ [Lacinutrix sp. 5H-3-7-4]AEH01922.1 Beta-hydroxyacyl-(acyl-carrier-protein) dehydratase FabA/FabZ [Lacinutrix sp. 5H-3-7-4]